ncbi:hypothetical protein EV586_103274 [Tumebacillus sp. BK434]|uniref:CBO0543 family protein n=1 Tax=Tumebacillus sp. BK434 TaxID=2512169 RepID=UPI001046456D|nr:CBO0543 family protein [Tumebacillus sp. BK434]TCP55621.1 hypothetical protein EV586_103274 [Tumebacillus sp. BK434]
MRLEIWIWIFAWLSIPLVLYLLVPRTKVPDAHIVFLFAQLLTWTIDLLNVQFDLVQFPYREFQYATKTSFTLHYIFYPGVFVLYALFVPERRGWPVRVGYHALWTLLIVLFIYALDRYTELVKLVYTNFFLRFGITLTLLLLTRVFYVWYRKGFRAAEDGTESAA